MIKTAPFVITISRQLGSGGAYVGQMLAKNLNIFYADREIIYQAAKQLSVLEENVESREEKVHSFWQSYIRSFAFYAPETYTPPIITPTDRQLFYAEAEIIKSITNEHSAVIIGRCGSQILCEHPDHVSIFLHSDITFRKDRVQKLYDVSEEAAEKIIIMSDNDRARYIHKFTGKEWTDSRQYSLSVDTGKISIDNCIELLLKYVELGRS